MREAKKQRQSSEGPSSLNLFGHPPRLRPLHQIHSYEDLGGLPQLDDVDDILQCRDREADESDELWPGEALQPRKGGSDWEGNRCGYPMCEVKGNKEDFVSCTDEEKRRLVGIHGEERVLN